MAGHENKGTACIAREALWLGEGWAPERAMGRMARRSMSAASLASKSTDGRVMGPRAAASGAGPRADLMACSCAAIEAMAWFGGGWCVAAAAAKP
jgi:hypothetical protein